jgi:hypothetical protein
MDEDGGLSPNELLRRLDKCLERAKRVQFGETMDGIALEKGDVLIFSWDAIPRLYSFCWKMLPGLRPYGGELVMRTSLPLLLINPQNYTALNMRKEVLQQSDSSVLLAELRFVDLIQTKHAKEGDLFHHRRFVIERLRNLSCKVDLVRECLASQACVDWHPRNYLAWKHRLFVSELMSKAELEEEKKRISSRDPSALSYLRHIDQLLNIK